MIRETELAFFWEVSVAVDVEEDVDDDDVDEEEDDVDEENMRFFSRLARARLGGGAAKMRPGSAGRWDSAIMTASSVDTATSMR